MALGASIPPWLNPPDYINAMNQGARTGLARAQLDTEAQEARDKLRFAYESLMAKSADEAADRAMRGNIAELSRRDALDRWAAEHGFKQEQSALNQDYRNQVIATRNRENDIREKALNRALGAKNADTHIGDHMIRLGEDGQYHVVYDAGAGRIHPFDRLDYEAARKSKHDAEQKLAGGGLSAKDTAFWKGQIDASEKMLQQIRAKYLGTTSPVDSSGQDMFNDLTTPATTGGPAWNTPIPGSATDLSAPSMPDTAIDLGLPDEKASEIRVLNIRPKQ